MSPRLADRLTALRRQRFVGREDERDLFRSVLAAPQLPFNVLYVHGPGGIGKTTLLRELLHTAGEMGVAATYLDAREMEPTPDSFLRAIGAALEEPWTGSPLEALAAGTERRVILVDTYEVLAPLDSWLREVFLPELSESVLTVLAGRHPPSRAWRADPGWQTLVRALPLRTLSAEESRRYLAQRQVPEAAQRAAVEFTHGHPLALSLVADVLEQDPRQTFHPTDAPDVIRMLLEHFVQEVPSPAHRTALEACALFRLTTESLLAEVLDTPAAAAETFHWLRGLSFVDSGPLGAFPHDLARDALSADLRWRNPDRYAELHNRARAYYLRRLSQTRGQEQQRVLSEYVYLHRDNPVIKPFLDWAETGTAVPDALTEADVPALLRMVARHEGEESARLAEHWLRRQPEGVMVFRGAGQEPTGFLAMVRLETANEDDREADPAIRAACHYLAEHAPLRRGERATHFRFWMSAEAHQGVSPTQSLVFLKLAQHYLTTQGLAFTFFPVVDAEFWAPFCSYIDLARLPEAEFEVGGRRFGVFGHDWRVVPPMVWLDLLAQREMDTSPPEGPTPAAAPPPRLVVLDESEFTAAVHDALRSLTRPRELRRSPLLQSRVVAAEAGPDAGEAECAAALQALLRRAAETLRASPRQSRLYDALHHAYFHPASTQERAAQLLYVSFSTFRRHLRAGVDHVAATLWEWEVEGRRGPDGG